MVLIEKHVIHKPGCAPKIQYVQSGGYAEMVSTLEELAKDVEFDSYTEKDGSGYVEVMPLTRDEWLTYTDLLKAQYDQICAELEGRRGTPWQREPEDPILDFETIKTHKEALATRESHQKRGTPILTPEIIDLMDEYKAKTKQKYTEILEEVHEYCDFFMDCFSDEILQQEMVGTDELRIIDDDDKSLCFDLLPGEIYVAGTLHGVGVGGTISEQDLDSDLRKVSDVAMSGIELLIRKEVSVDYIKELIGEKVAGRTQRWYEYIDASDLDSQVETGYEILEEETPGRRSEPGSYAGVLDAPIQMEETTEAPVKRVKKKVRRPLHATKIHVEAYDSVVQIDGATYKKAKE